MSTEDEFISSDPFDPEVAIAAENKAYEATTDNDEKLAEYIRRRQRAYRAVFSGEGDKADIEFVMLDLAAFCRAYKPTFHPTNPKIQDLLEGRREVFQRIMDFTHLSHDTLYIKYTDAQTKIG